VAPLAAGMPPARNCDAATIASVATLHYSHFLAQMISCKLMLVTGISWFIIVPTQLWSVQTIFLALMYTGNANWASAGCGAHIPLPQNSKLAPFLCYICAFLRVLYNLEILLKFPMSNSSNLHYMVINRSSWNAQQDFCFQAVARNFTKISKTATTM